MRRLRPHGCLLLAAPGAASDPNALTHIVAGLRRNLVTSPNSRYTECWHSARLCPRIWLVLRQIKLDSDHYDLCADLNVNGDLTEAAERFMGQAEGDEVRFSLPISRNRSCCHARSSVSG